MDAFSGCEPLVGEIVGLRTFRVDESGLLLPLYSNLSWYNGVNRATCAPPTGERGGGHDFAAECDCGFYAYGTVEAADQNHALRYVQAVVSCWGEVVAGTHGFRAQYARIDALWLNPTVPKWVRHRIASRYPSAAMYADRAAMLAEHPLTALDCYEAIEPKPVWPKVAAAAVGWEVMVLGLLPETVLEGSAVLRGAWLLSTVGVGLVALWLMFGVHSYGHRAAAFVASEIVAWLIAPLFGLPGWVLRVPVLRAVSHSAMNYLRSLRKGYFPIVTSPKEKAFCGVRP